MWQGYFHWSTVQPTTEEYISSSEQHSLQGLGLDALLAQLMDKRQTVVLLELDEFLTVIKVHWLLCWCYFHATLSTEWTLFPSINISKRMMNCSRNCDFEILFFLFFTLHQYVGVGRSHLKEKAEKTRGQRQRMQVKLDEKTHSNKTEKDNAGGKLTRLKCTNTSSLKTVRKEDKDRKSQ